MPNMSGLNEAAIDNPHGLVRSDVLFIIGEA